MTPTPPPETAPETTTGRFPYEGPQLSPAEAAELLVKLGEMRAERDRYRTAWEQRPVVTVAWVDHDEDDGDLHETGFIERVEGDEAVINCDCGPRRVRRPLSALTLGRVARDAPGPIETVEHRVVGTGPSGFQHESHVTLRADYDDWSERPDWTGVRFESRTVRTWTSGWRPVPDDTEGEQ